MIEHFSRFQSLLALTLLALVGCTMGQPELPAANSPETLVDQVIAVNHNQPGVVVAVVQSGWIAFAKAYGAADLTHGVPFHTDTRSNLGSTSKQFTAFAIALLASRGRLSLDDDVRKYIPELPDFGETVTLRHLLTHTSGYREIYLTLRLSGRRPFEDHVDREEVIHVVKRQPELQNAPGAQWNYNNTGYGLLAFVVERVTGQAFPDWMRNNIFLPLGMTNTVVRPDSSDIVRNSARGYMPKAGGYREVKDLDGALGASAVYTTVGDLALWMRNFRTGELGGTAILKEMTTPYTLTTGETSRYGLGLYVDRWRGQKRVYHGGDDAGHHAIMLFFPELDAGVIVLSNDASFNQYEAANKLAGIFFGEKLRPDDATLSRASFDPADFDPFTGRYELESTPGFVFTFRREGDRLLSEAAGDEVELIPLSKSEFKVMGQDARIQFRRNTQGLVTSATLFHQGEQTLRRLAEDEVVVNRSLDLSQYAGRYYSEELETYYTLTIETEGLVLRNRLFKSPVQLRPMQGERFSGSMPIASLTFERNAQQQVKGFRVGNGSSQEYVWFERLD